MDGKRHLLSSVFIIILLHSTQNVPRDIVGCHWSSILCLVKIRRPHEREREREREGLLRGTGVTAANKKQVQLQPSNYTHSLQHTAYHSILLLQLPSTATNSFPNVLLYREEHRTQSNQINQYFIVCSILVLMLNWIECPLLPV